MGAPRNSKTHCSGLVVSRLSCLARHGKECGLKRLPLAEGYEQSGGREEGLVGEATDPKRLHIHRRRPIHNVCLSRGARLLPPPIRQDLVLFYSDPTPSSDGDFTAHKAAWVFHYPPHPPPPARDMCSRKRHSFIHWRATVVATYGP